MSSKKAILLAVGLGGFLFVTFMIGGVSTVAVLVYAAHRHEEIAKVSKPEAPALGKESKPMLSPKKTSTPMVDTPRHEELAKDSKPEAPPSGKESKPMPSAKASPPGDMTIKEFVLQKPAGAVALESSCQLATYYNYAFQNSAATHYSFCLTDRSERIGIYVYAPKNSDYGQRLYEKLKDGSRVSVTVRVQRAGPSGKELPARDDQCFALVGIVDAK
jgi:hypothetical protein